MPARGSLQTERVTRYTFPTLEEIMATKKAAKKKQRKPRINPKPFWFESLIQAVYESPPCTKALRDACLDWLSDPQPVPEKLVFPKDYK